MAEIEYKNIDDSQKQLFPEADKPPYFYLRAGEWRVLPRDWEAKFEKIINDNRCPARLPAVCEVAGSATIQIQLRRKGEAKTNTKVFKVEGLNRFNEKLKEGLLHPVTIHSEENGVENRNQSIIITLADLHPYSLLDSKASKDTPSIALLRVVPARTNVHP